MTTENDSARKDAFLFTSRVSTVSTKHLSPRGVGGRKIATERRGLSPFVIHGWRTVSTDGLTASQLLKTLAVMD